MICFLQVLGIYTFTKRCILEENENKQRKTQVFLVNSQRGVVIVELVFKGRSLAHVYYSCSIVLFLRVTVLSVTSISCIMTVIWRLWGEKTFLLPLRLFQTDEMLVFTVTFIMKEKCRHTLGAFTSAIISNISPFYSCQTPAKRLISLISSQFDQLTLSGQYGKILSLITCPCQLTTTSCDNVQVN